MREVCAPAGPGEAEFTEKRSRFLGAVIPAGTEEEAKDFIASVRSRHYDARHNVWAYITSDGGTARSSDDGEPQGTGGVPVLNVLQGAGLTGVCCVVTRYFGGVLLGAGNLSRAYARAAKLALAEAGVKRMTGRCRYRVDCDYAQLGGIQRILSDLGGTTDGIEYLERVTLCALLPPEHGGEFARKVMETTAGAVLPVLDGERLVSAEN